MAKVIVIATLIAANVLAVQGQGFDRLVEGDRYGVVSAESAPQEQFLASLLTAGIEADEANVGRSQQLYHEQLQHYRGRQPKYRTDEQFLEYLFYRVHRKQLKKYQQYVSLADQFESGSYDCLTATTLYYLYLRDLGYAVDMVETEYHIYLKVKTGDGIVLFESTDPMSGFVTSEEEIRLREASYGNGQAEPGVSGLSASTPASRNGFLLNDSVAEQELLGLHYFNQAVLAWNAGLPARAIVLIEKAYELYPSKRIKSIRATFKGHTNLLASKQ